ncbi:DNA-binding protein [Adonisia turfae]|uniref:KfrA N-terminal DNA-binding domain-containing protein n=1 Tax=Adonisia turfae CCMR0081 TaxID=2292702 RepID=A0A6M0RFJ9_9CYAN|nr:DNA-binding protein [Adonisia turfae]NEZ55006.1 hypothetical protein [Adonisia turfae CCMR0081]
MGGRVTKDQIYAAAKLLIEQGEVPGPKNVKRKCGGTGSPNTYVKYLKEFRADHPDLMSTVGPPDKNIPRELEPKFKEVYNILNEAVELREFSGRVADLTEENEKLIEEKEVLEKLVIELRTTIEVVNEQAKKRHQELLERISELEKRLANS